MNKTKTSKFLATAALALAAGFSGAELSAETIRIAEHRQARIDELNAVIPAIEAKLDVDVELIEYPAPEKDYLTKLLTELRAGNAPDVFTAPRGQDVADMVAAGYLAPIGTEVRDWEGYGDLFDVAKDLITDADGEIHVLPNILSVQQIYFRRDVLEAAGISSEQPADWAELLERAKEIKDKTGQYALLFPSGLTWGGGAFGEGFGYLVLGSSTKQLANDDGTLNLTDAGIKDVFGFYEELVANDLMPIDPMLGPEPWIIPKYEMFPAGELVATTCGTWCYIYDWGPQSRNPIPNVTSAVGTWAVPGKDGGQHVVVDIDSPWGVNSNALNVELAKQVLLEIGSVESGVSYATQIGNIPARRSAGDNAEFQKLEALVPIHKNADDGTFLRTATGFSVVSEGVARATEALLRGEADAAGAQNILVKYSRDLLGDEAVK